LKKTIKTMPPISGGFADVWENAGKGETGQKAVRIDWTPGSAAALGGRILVEKTKIN